MTDDCHGEPTRLPSRQELDERVSFALAAARMGVFEWSPESDALRWWSSSTGLGITAEEAPANGRAFLELIHPDDRSEVLATRARALHEHSDAVSEFRIVLADGTVHWVRGHGRVVYDATARPIRVLGVNTDITERKSLERRLRETDVEAQRLHVLKATMRTVQNIVNNALTSLQLFRFEAEPHVGSEALSLFDRIIEDTAAQLKALADLDHVIEMEMGAGTGIRYPSSQGADESNRT